MSPASGLSQQGGAWGVPPASAVGYPAFGGGAPPRNGMGVASLVLGIVGLVTCCTFIPGVLAIVFGIIGMNRAKAGEATNGGMALTGLILGCVATALAVMVGILQLIGALGGLMDTSGIASV